VRSERSVARPFIEKTGVEKNRCWQKPVLAKTGVGKNLCWQIEQTVESVIGFW
jgi:hypothetical protein